MGTPLVKQSTNLDTIVRLLLPRFKAANRPFVLVYRVGSGAGYPLPASGPVNYKTGGDDEPALKTTVETADEALAAIEDSLRKLDVYDNTNVIVAAERGASFVWRASATSAAIKVLAPSGRWGSMTPGFLAVDLATALGKQDPGLSLFDPDNGNKFLDIAQREHPMLGNGMIGASPDKPLVYVDSRGDHDSIFFPERLTKPEARRLAQRIVEATLRHDYAGGVFVNELRVGQPRGTLPLRVRQAKPVEGGRYVERICVLKPSGEIRR